MKLSVSLSAVLVLLPALVAGAASPLDAGHGGLYMPRHRARHFGRQRQGGFGNGGSNRGGNNNGQNQNQNKGGNNGAASSSSAAVSTTSASTTAAAATTSSAAATTSAASTASASASIAANNNGRGGRGRNRGGNNNKGNNNNGNTTTSVAKTASSTSSAAAATTAANNGNNGNNNKGNNNNGNNNNGNNNNGNNGNNNNDPNTSLTLSPNLVATNLAQDGQATPIAGQVASLTSRNNFINFCAGKTITNGQQITGGSCNPIPMGDIIPQAKMPSCKFQFPENFGTIQANQPFTVRMRLDNLQAGTFTNAQKTYYMAPQFLNNNGVLIGHTHVVIQKMGAFDDPAILDPKTFAFFKGVNTGQNNGVVTADVTAGLPAGNYRMASINTSANHTPAIAAVAQHGWLDDITYFTVQ